MKFGGGWAGQFSGGQQVHRFGMDVFHAVCSQPLFTIIGVVADALFVLLKEPGVIHGAKFPEEDGFGFLVEFCWGEHGYFTLCSQ